MKLSERLRHIQKNMRVVITFALVTILVLEILFLVVAHHNTLERQKQKANSYGEKIITSISEELSESVSTTLLLEDLYIVYQDSFLQDFEDICAHFIKDNIAIGSLYFAPDGIIRYAYPDEIDDATELFEMLKDPIQGPKAQQALNDKIPTIAGPHDLIEGGVGFIIRTPIFVDDNFVGFTILVLDKNTFLDEVLKNLSEEEMAYNFAVWKTPDSTAVLDENGYIFSNCDKMVSKDVVLPFKAPNDTWYLAIEPVNGWNPWVSMLGEVIVSLLIMLLLILGVILIIYQFSIQRIRELNQQEEANNVLLQAALNKAEQANNAKTQFLFTMSHDIRTPMNAIIGFTDLVEQNLSDSDKCHDYIHKIKSSNTYLLSLLNNVLEMSKFEKGDIELEENAFQIDHLVHTLYSVFELEMEEKELNFKINNNISHPCFYCDETKLREVYLNIISNAMKYTHEGGNVTITLNEKPSLNTETVLVESVISDTGVGISKEFLPHIFETFSREQTVTENKITGSGLGLSITQRLVELMNGFIKIESDVGVGTTVTFTIPFKLASEQQLPDDYLQEEVILPSDFTGKKVLLVEDNELNREIALSILEDEGFIIDTAEDGAIAVEKIKSAEIGQYDLILMDIQMPNMNGYDATINIRQLGTPELANIPIIAMTANAFDDDRKNAFDAGMNGFVPKPIDIPVLFQELGAVL